MDNKHSLPYGLWPSSISPAALGLAARLDDVMFDSDGETLVWLERRSGRGMLVVKRPGDAPHDLTGDMKVSAGVGYGGGDFTVRGGKAVFVSAGRLFSVALDGSSAPRPLTPPFGDCASPDISPDGSKILYVRSFERVDSLEMVDAEGLHWPIKLAQGADFYMQPTWHPDGKRIAWVEWNHPQMPWDGARLMTARLEGATLADVTCLAGDENTPVFQPVFSPDGRQLACIIQDGEWDKLCLWNLVSGECRVLASECSLLDPAWIQGLRSLAWTPDSSRLYFLRNDLGFRSLWAVEAGSGSLEKLSVEPYTWIDQISAGQGSQIAFLASSSQKQRVIAILQNGALKVQRYSAAMPILPETLPSVQAVSWAAPDGTPVHGLYYAPVSTKFISEGLPPAIVNIHGGPTSARVTDWNTNAAFFTTRGYAFLEVNYRGSTGYGRSYMLALRQKWGLVDVEDAVGAAGALGELGLADPKRIVIMGGSAGGYTVLNALVRHPGIFKAGVDLYGLANLFITETHKFEERYNDSLIGVLPQDAERYRAWSPVFFAHQIHDAVAVFQGAEDNVVPPSHSEQIVAALRTNKVPHIYKLYEGEGHGWRKTETIADYYDRVEKFLQEYVLYA